MFSFLNSVELKDGREALSLSSDRVTQPTQRGLQPEDWKGQRPNQPKKTSRRGKFRDGSAMRKVLSDVTATKCTCTTATALQLHCTSGSHWGWSRFSCGGFFQVVGQVGRSVAQSVEVTPKRSIERGGRSQRLRGPSPQKSQRL